MKKHIGFMIFEYIFLEGCGITPEKSKDHFSMFFFNKLRPKSPFAMLLMIEQLEKKKQSRFHFWKHRN